METPPLSSTLISLMIAWGVITVVFIVMCIYRSVLGLSEEDQLFLEKGEEGMARDQRKLIARIQKLSKPIMILGILSGVLLLVIAGVWVAEVAKIF